MSATGSGARLMVAVNERDHIRGPARALVTMVEYGDYECPHCGRFQYIVNELESRLHRSLRTVYRHFPLSELHPHARLAAEAAEAAAAQGKFWEMHALLFEHQSVLSTSTIFELAAALQLEMAQFRLELNEHTHGDRVWSDLMGGVRSGVNATPTVFLNGARYDGSHDAESLMNAMAGASQPAAVKAQEIRVKR